MSEYKEEMTEKEIITILRRHKYPIYRKKGKLNYEKILRSIVHDLNDIIGERNG